MIAVPTSLCNLLKCKAFPSALGGFDQVQIPLCGKATTLMPRGGSRVWDAEISGEFGDGGPDARNVFHADTLRNLRIYVNTQIAQCAGIRVLVTCILRMEANYA